mmetsp:Transcript_29523/g.78492  ORF Transcript_29523/g.78492 Transcript_29523/m.78492 type:complete len:97 (+) Transcript_29523:1-291(+)
MLRLAAAAPPQSAAASAAEWEAAVLLELSAALGARGVVDGGAVLARAALALALWQVALLSAGAERGFARGGAVATTGSAEHALASTAWHAESSLAA